MPVDVYCLTDALHANALRCGNDRALIWISPADPNHARSVTWSELNRWVGALARRLVETTSIRFADDGETEHRRISHAVENHSDDVLMALACQAAGIVEFPIDASGGQPYVQACRNRADADWIDQSSKHQLVCQAWEHRDCGDVSLGTPTAIAPQRDALVLWTSGTTGEPNGVVLSHASLLCNAQAKLSAVPQTREDRRLTVLSIAHAYARTCDLGTWLLSGCELAIARGYEGWTALAETYQPTHCNSVPSLASRILHDGPLPDSLRVLGCGGAALAAADFEAWRQRDVAVVQGYGLTESGPVISSQTPADCIAGFAGRLVSGWEHRIEQDRLWVRGAHQMSRYWMDPHSTKQRIDAQDWLDTGDLVRICDDSGQLQILGRSDDRLVLSNGYKVDPMCIEKRLQSILGVRTAVITINPDGRSVDAWFEMQDAGASPPSTGAILSTHPSWEQPRQLRTFTIPPQDRESLFNRKGSIRRQPMLRFLSHIAQSQS
ncbi:acyl--CoA ligase [Stieleria sp. TO1_6]|uniref:class I adenylate-forming enzyme family protein n=1 Tax=Stieleria tagensis TaxID=2956795 RepID=UPI00209B5369|nr:AMP-binding protein [Stieleria tagensis]MCO8122973.1 acyl--CoA ligase [Stieleria tagensis]